MKTISEILREYETDKNKSTRPGYPGHSYGPSYDEIFEQFDREGSLNFLEIGVQHGPSLWAWSDYFTNATIYGVDIRDMRTGRYKEERKNINFILSDIKDPALKERFSNTKFDIIIDDGSHILSDVLNVVDNYLDTLKTGGVLIVEDCQRPEEWLAAIKNRVPPGYEVSSKDLRRIVGRYDDFLIIIKNQG